MKRLIPAVLILALLIPFSSCVTNSHIVGMGPEGSHSETKTQWYAAWGLAQLNRVDTREMASEKQNYEVKTYFSFLDFLLICFLGPISIMTRTVEVIR